tara:strand:+ start:694 stop:1098 length:405 start_codon:yes stop_codon:yes gene_type:complete
MNITPALLNGVFGLIDDLFTTDEERSNAKLKAMELAAAGDLGQLAVNTEEAKSSNVFVAGWRPFIGWTCGIAFAFAFVIAPLIETLVVYAYIFAGIEVDTTGLPKLDITEMLPVLLGMLGLGSLRTFEKTTKQV